MKNFLGVDMGGTATRWVIVDEAGTIVDRGLTHGATGVIVDAIGLARMTGALEQVRDALPVDFEYAQFGITGSGFQRNRYIEEQVSSVFGKTLNQFSYANDIVMSWRAAFPNGNGHIVSAGTGSLGMTMDDDGNPAVVGGHGYMIDDGGSGAWIALQALRTVYRRFDEAENAGDARILASALFEAMGGKEREVVRSFVYSNDRGKLGTLAVAVARAAREGDIVAIGIIEQAGFELVRLAKLLIKRWGRKPTTFVGGVLALHPLVQDVIERELKGLDLKFERIDAALNTANFARDKGLELI